MSATRVVVSGVGVVSPLGRSRGELHRALVDGRSGDGAVPGFDPAREVGRTKQLKYMSRASALAVAAGRAAMAEAGLPGGDEVGVYLGIGMTSSELNDLDRLVGVATGGDGRLSLALLGERALKATNPLISFKILTNMPLCHLAISLGLRGPSAALHSLGGETVDALRQAVLDLEEGRARAALVGGVDAQLDRAGVEALTRKGVITPGGRRLAEGAACLVLEREEDLRARGGRPLARVGSIALAPSGTLEHRPVPAPPIREALARSLERGPAAVLTSLCGDPEGDASELEALRAVGQGPDTLVATRGALGDALAAGPAFDLALAVASLEAGTLPAPGAPPIGPGALLVLAAGVSATVGSCLLEAP